MRCAFAAVLIWILLAAATAAAHPLGNFSISHYTAIRVERDAVELSYVIDMAEIPTFQEIQEKGIVAEAGDAALPAYLARKAEILKQGLLLTVDGRRTSLRAESPEVIFPPGAGSLPTMKIAVRYRAKLDAATAQGPRALYYRDENFPGRAGWKEIVAAAGDGVELFSTTVPETDRSGRLSDYPTDLLNSPPQQLEAQATFKVMALPVARGENAPARRVVVTMAEKKAPATVAVAATNEKLKNDIAAPARRLEANRQGTPRSAFTELIAARNLDLGIVLIALCVSIGLGAFHALEPGHGKTLVAAYLVGSRGTVRHALWLGVIVTAAHTAGVYLLGGLTLYASRYVVPERLYPWLSLASGALITVMGLVLFLRRYRAKGGSISAHEHAHLHHAGHGHSHDHRHHHHAHQPTGAVSLRELFALGISGGIVPCPAALVVLLSAVALQRVGFGLLLIVAFSAGLAAVLIAVGLLVVYAQRFAGSFQPGDGWTTRYLSLASSAFIVLFGAALSFQGLGAAGLIR